MGLTSFRRITIAETLAHRRRERAIGIVWTAVSLSNAPPTRPLHLIRDGPGIGRIQVIQVSSERIGPQRPSVAGRLSPRIADKCARLYRASTLVALRRGRETYETAALPLSYVGPDAE